MSVRRVFCPVCNSPQLRVVKEHNPDTQDMNMDVTYLCENPMCGHEWEGRAISHHAREMQRRGRLRI